MRYYCHQVADTTMNRWEMLPHWDWWAILRVEILQVGDTTGKLYYRREIL